MELKISNNDTSKRYLSIRRTVMALEVVESRSDDETTGSSNSTDNFCATRVNPVYEETREDADVDDEFGWDDEVTSPILESAPVPASDKQISDSIPEEGAESFEVTEFSTGTESTQESTESESSKKERRLENSENNVPKASSDNDDIDAPTIQSLPSISNNHKDDVPSENASGNDGNVSVQHIATSRNLHQWDDALETLRNNPSLVNANILHLALHHRAPLSVIRFMIQINPNAAEVPKAGPSALQVAVRYHDSLDVVEEIIRACPHAIFAGNGTYDALSYAKIWRGDDESLIQMLERPISYWLQSSYDYNSIQNNHSKKNKKAQVRFKEPLSSGAIFCESPEFNSKHKASPNRPPTPTFHSNSGLTRVEQQEMLNIKLIAAAIVRSQKKFISDSEQERQEIDAKIHSLQLREEKIRKEFVESVEECINSKAKEYLLAINTKERAFFARVDRVGKLQSSRHKEVVDNIDGVISAVKETMNAVTAKIERISSSNGNKLAELTVKVEKEAVASAIFRHRMTKNQNLLPARVEESEPSFDLESLHRTKSTDCLVDEDFGGIDETVIMEGLGGNSSFDYSLDQDRLQSSFSSEWANGMTEWWMGEIEQSHFVSKPKKFRLGKLRRWLKLK